ncbi:nickel ABC transporter, membrane protein NikMN [Citrifermentans bemidjiense Bem]|uniref:Nickel ABC transporter, membrane protein NikMN n=1 Tax=Citrifermentans bemidjiense (strain ATCC BAA-1014 / DSM 16622 / JCM 12645 / Bem) TaxID=404380 RepID=B5EE92_CITBB|nr:energy-coupling factor ABC transporter permease [Citrifermentans bemidjiense]ACH39237.1 nickel ABC transporter, membrane protein NikMN [Citrifermentans bemidjiense Bem]
MHMADALLSPAVGGIMWAVSAGTIALGSAQLRREHDDRQAPLMGVLGAFLFAAQMINFSIPGTGSSGHLGGGLLLAVLLGPSASFLTIASVLVVQALFFADGGLLALGCNIFNLGVIPSFLVYPFLYRALSKGEMSKGDRHLAEPVPGGAPGKLRENAAVMISALVAMQLGSLAVVLETGLSGISSLPLERFLLLMQPIHLAIGAVEGAVTVAILSFVRKARPELLRRAPDNAGRSRFAVLLAFLVIALVTGGFLSQLASKNPDGLEWSFAKAGGKVAAPGAGEGVHGLLAHLQEKSAWFPDYAVKRAAPRPLPSGAGDLPDAASAVPGVVGTILTLALVCVAGALLKRGKERVETPDA